MSKIPVIRDNTPEEELEIQAQIATDPDTWTIKDFSKGRRGRPVTLNPKQSVSIRLDPDIIAHFKSQGPGWQTRVNKALREAAGLK